MSPDSKDADDAAADAAAENVEKAIRAILLKLEQGAKCECALCVRTIIEDGVEYPRFDRDA